MEKMTTRYVLDSEGNPYNRKVIRWLNSHNHAFFCAISSLSFAGMSLGFCFHPVFNRLMSDPVNGGAAIVCAGITIYSAAALWDDIKKKNVENPNQGLNKGQIPDISKLSPSAQCYVGLKRLTALIESGIAYIKESPVRYQQKLALERLQRQEERDLKFRRSNYEKDVAEGFVPDNVTFLR